MGSLPQPADPPSTEQLVHAPLTNLETTLNSLLTSLTTTPTYSTAPGITNSLLQADDALTSALQTLHTHQKNYERILAIRAEAESLENRIKDTVRTCLQLRREIDDVNPGALMREEHDEGGDEADGEDDDEETRRDVDYHTLLSLASRIGKHNVAAEKEAEEESVRRLLKARETERGESLKKHSKTTTAGAAAADTTATTAEAKVNGVNTSVAHATEKNAPAAAKSAPSPTHPPESWITQNERDWLDSGAAMERARLGMAFPPGERLRMGLLGRAQWVREQGGEEAVERLLAEMEGRNPIVGAEGDGAAAGGHSAEGLPGQQQQEEEEEGRSKLQSRPPPPPPPLESSQPHQQPAPRAPAPQQQQQQQQQQPERKKSVPLDLDMWNEDDEDDD